MPTYLGPDGTALHHEVRGGGRPTDPPVVVLAGGAGRHPDYLGDLAGLTDVADLVVPHLRGVGESPAPADSEVGSYWRQADDLEALRAALGAERLVLVAHSAGTRLAVSYAAQHADHLAAMVLVCPPTGYLVDEPGDAAVLAAARAGEPAFDDAWAALHDGPDTTDDAAFNAWERRTAPAAWATWDDTARTHALVGPWSLAAAQAWFATLPPADLAARLWDVRAPVLVVGGDRDCLTGVAPVLALADLFPDRTSVILPGCGHHPWVEAPAAFRAAVDPFLDAATVRASDSGRAALLRNGPSG
ncbi:alpha/beta fold hydrolase [Kineosporia sp. R_H_3]|uniref:alpha/beta fold hydrolase n=1 Tax=Kineosporia sp. R_H_3 TaxID=1961848 RepID=UPI000B4B72FD|nr:alpha/beta hydrolase [Kineosporia sp. R_H_3]